jgi:hypothetical protein
VLDKPLPQSRLQLFLVEAEAQIELIDALTPPALFGGEQKSGCERYVKQNGGR